MIGSKISISKILLFIRKSDLKVIEICIDLFLSEQELKTKMELLKEEKDKCEKEYRTWQDSCEKWKTAHADHPNKQLFDKYISEVR